MSDSTEDARDYLEALLTEVQSLRESLQANSELLIEHSQALNQNTRILSHLAEGATATHSPVEDLLRKGAAAFMRPDPRKRRRQR
jgi:hypothetical protein